MQINSLCMLCKNKVESLKHLLIDSEFSKEAYSRMVLNDNLLTSSVYSMQDWMILLYQAWEDKLDHEDLWRKLVVTWWRTWNARNERIIQQISRTVKDVLLFIDLQVKELCFVLAMN